MQTDITNEIKIVNTTIGDFSVILWFFEQAQKLQEKNGYLVWHTIDKAGLKKDIENNLQYKILKGNDILCVFSIQHHDPFIWRERDNNDALYLHRVVAHPDFKGEKQFEKVLNWSKQFARQNHLKFIRIDTWASNKRLIDYYKSFGFKFIENYKTTDTPELPLQNRNLNVALFEINVMDC